MRKRLLFTAIAIIALLVGCATKTPNQETITLEGNPTTGYQWTCRIENEDIVSLVSSQYKTNNSSQNMVGVGGKYYFVFAPVSNGKTTITFEYSRSWETEAISTLTYIAEVRNEIIVLTQQ